jgi:hypothetical protein
VNSRTIIQAWRDFLYARDLEQIKLPAKNVIQEQKIQFADLLTQTNEQHTLQLSESCKQHIIEHYCLKKKGECQLKSGTAYLLFPLMQTQETQDKGYKATMLYPLFLLELTSEALIDFNLLTLPTLESGQIIPLTSSFKAILDIDIEEYGSDTSFMDFISQVTDEQYSGFGEAWVALLTYISANSKSTYQKTAAFDAMITEFSNTQGMSATVRREFDHYVKKDIPKKYPLLHHYLQKKSVSSENKTAELPIYGLFEKQYPLGKGQLSVVRDIQSGQTLIGVQGAPGTGKTTLFKSIIANQIVQKALSIIAGESKNYGMLIVSTANTAVDGVIDDLKKEEALKDIPWLYFRGGNRARFDQEVSKIDDLITAIRSAKPDLDKAADLKKKILLKKAAIDDDFNRYQHACGNLSSLGQWFCAQGVEVYFELDCVQAFADQLVNKGFWGIKSLWLWYISPGFKKEVAEFYNENTAKLKYFDIDSIDRQMIETWYALAVFTQSIDCAYKKNILLQLIDKSFSRSEVSLGQVLKELFISPNNTLHQLAIQFEYFNQHYPDGSFLSYQRTQHIVINRELFDLSIEYLYEHMLYLGDELTKALTVWRDTVTGKNKQAYMKYNDDYNTFHNLITLAYPVMASTLASAYRQAVTGYNFLENNRPFNLCLCDEAGMIAAHDMVPALARSHRAVIVGDPLQLEPIGSLSHHRQEELRQNHFDSDDAAYLRLSPQMVTAFHRACGCASGSYDEVGDSTILEEHRRCQKPIADLFIELAGYRGVKVETAMPKERIQQAFDAFGGHHLMFYSVDG